MNFINSILVSASALRMENKAWQLLLKDTQQAHSMVRRNLIFLGEEGAQIKLKERLQKAEKVFIQTIEIVDTVRERLKY